MVKIENKINKKDYLIKLYEILIKNIKFDYEFAAIYEVIKAMYGVDKELGLEWTINYFNRYGSLALGDYRANNKRFGEPCGNIVLDLLQVLCDNLEIDQVILNIYNNVKYLEIRFLLWRYLFSPYLNNQATEKFNEYVIDKKYDKAYRMIVLILEHQDEIPYEIFDAIEFLNCLISNYTDKEIKKQEVLDLLYSLVDLISSDSGKAVLYSNFLNYI